MEVVLNVNNVHFGESLRDISMYIDKNTITSIAGSNNSGKTILLKIIGRIFDTNANIVFDGKNIYDYKLTDYIKFVSVIIPKEITFIENTLEEELIIEANEYNEDAKSKIDYLVSGLKIKKMLTKNINQLTTKELILSQIALSLVNDKKLLLIDNIEYYFNNNELKKINSFLKSYIKDFGLTVLYTTTNLNQTLYSDYLYVIDKGKVILRGEPKTVLQNDNTINKAGLDVPFMIDLSVKLRDYDLINKIILDKESLVEEIWK